MKNPRFLRKLKRHDFNRLQLAGGVLTVLVIAGFGTYRIFIARAATVNVPASINSSCGADVTSQLTSWVNSQPDGSYILFPKNACYLVNGSITVTRKNGLTFDGNGSTFKANRNPASADENRSQWHTDYGSNLTFTNMTLQGVNTNPRYTATYDYDHNLFIRGTDGVKVDRITAKDAWADNITMTQGLDWSTPTRNVTITNSTLDVSGRMSISCTDCEYVTVDHNNITNSAITPFDLEIEGNNFIGRHIKFTNNTMSGVLGSTMFSIGAPTNYTGVDISDVYIANNRITSWSNTSFDCLPAVSMVYSKSHVNGITIENNEMNSVSDGVAIVNASNAIVRNNIIHYQKKCGGGAGVKFTNVTNGTIQNNDLAGYASVYGNAGGNSGVTQCGNRITAGGAFNLPAACSSAQPAPGPSGTLGPGGGSSGGGGSDGGGSGDGSGGGSGGGTTPPPSGWPTTPVMVPFHMNAGDKGYTDPSGTKWTDDSYYSGGDSDQQAVGHAIAGTSNPQLYQSEHWGTFGYSIPVANGTYDLRLHFAEIYPGGQMVGHRVFNVTAEGSTILSNFDVYAQVGGYTALVVDKTVKVSDGELDIGVSPDTSTMAGVEILPANGSGGGDDTGGTMAAPGDANNDGRVNGIDYSMLAEHDGQSYAAADFNGDGTVGAADLAILISHWTW